MLMSMFLTTLFAGATALSGVKTIAPGASEGHGSSAFGSASSTETSASSSSASSTAFVEAMQVRACNQAVEDIIGPAADTGEIMEHVVSRSDTIGAGDLVVIFQSFSDLTFVYATPSGIHQNKLGTFHHDDFIGRRFGSKLQSRCSDGFVYLLRPTAELWARSLPHRTQIVHELDQSYIVFMLGIRPGSIVLESGTGSGAMRFVSCGIVGIR